MKDPLMHLTLCACMNYSEQIIAPQNQTYPVF